MANNQSKSNKAFKITGDWEIQSKQLKSKYSQLTDSGLKFEPGQENKLLNKKETRLNKKHNEVITIIKQIKSKKK